MRSAAGASAVLPQSQKRRSDRRKKQDRRTKARKVQGLANGGDTDAQEFQAAVWMDALEDVDPSQALLLQEDDDEYDALEELDGGGGNKRGNKRKKASKQAPGQMPKRFLPRTLGSILVEEANREEGSARAFCGRGSENTQSQTTIAQTKVLSRHRIGRDLYRTQEWDTLRELESIGTDSRTSTTVDDTGRDSGLLGSGQEFERRGISGSNDCFRWG